MLLFSLFLIPLVAAQDAEYIFETKYMEVPLDHYNFRENTTFQLKYLVNDTYFGPNGTIFIYAGNEGEIEMFAQNSGFIFDIAPQFNALIVFAEHRYYGESMPFGNLTYTTLENMGYLSTSQALGDFVYVINELQKIYAQPDDIKKLPAVAFGGSYGGMLAAWLKMKFPNSIIGAVASSAPIWMFKDQNPCNTFYNIITEDFKTIGSENCSDTIKRSWEVIRSFTKNSTGKSELSKLWDFCTPFETDEEIDKLVSSWLSEIYAALAEINYPYPTNFGQPLPAYPLKEFCSILDAKEVDDDISLLTAIGESFRMFTNYTGALKCHSLEGTTPTLGDFAWHFQECTEMIMPICSRDTDMFENFEYDFEAFSDGCYKDYGLRPRSQEVPLLEYGDKDLSTANNIIFSNGHLDPWSGYGVLTNVSSNIVVIVISEGVHHSELRAANEEDPESVKEARLIQIKHIKDWVDTYYGDTSDFGNFTPTNNIYYV